METMSSLRKIPGFIFALLYGAVFIAIFVPTVVPLGIVKLIRLLSRKFHRKALSFVVKLWARLTLYLSLSRVRIIGNFSPPPGGNIVYVANHQSFFDIPLIMGWVDPKVGFVAKESLFKIPVLGWWMREIGCIPVSRKASRRELSAFERMKKFLSAGGVLVIFPEGTRSPDGSLLPFKSSALKPAVDSKSTVIPVTIWGTKDIMPKGTFAISPARVFIKVGGPIKLTGDLDRKTLAEKLRRQIENNLSELAKSS